MKMYDKWKRIEEYLGADVMLEEVFKAMSSDEAEGMIDWIARQWSVDFGGGDDEE